MAEIKSTMDLVMERAARIGKASSEDLQRDEAQKKGMQLTAEYLDGTLASLMDTLDSMKEETQSAVRTGMAESLLRNIFLPRDDIQQQRTEKAAQGIIELAGGAGDIETICRELLQIISGYMQHRDELRGQLEEQVKMQYQQVLAKQGGQGGEEFEMDPALLPMFREEWGKIEVELNSRYSAALEQHKTNLKQRLGL
jgi:hypothetical protein